MDDFKKEEQIEKLMYEKNITVIFFSIYMMSTLISSILINSNKSSGYVFGIMLATTTAMILCVPNIQRKEILCLAANIIYFTLYPMLSQSYILKTLIILDYISFSLRFTIFINKKYLN